MPGKPLTFLETTMSAFQIELNKCSDRMRHSLCDCKAIAESHTHADCIPMWHALTWHGATVNAVETVAQAHAQYPQGFGGCDHYAAV